MPGVARELPETGMVLNGVEQITLLLLAWLLIFALNIFQEIISTLFSS
jgi:hypothetical protein